MFIILLKGIFLIVLLLISIAYFTLAERKILAATQRRRGPNVFGIYGLLQPLSDGLKLLLKESVFPSNSDKTLFGMAPLITFFISLINWSILPFDQNAFIAELDLSLLFMLASSSLGVYGILIAGWSSNSKYALMGSLRSSSQMISYEISIGIIITSFAVCAGSFNINNIIILQDKIGWFFFFFPIVFFFFFLCSLAETNRHPFDLPEAEAELVSGYNVEYSAMNFALFSLGEYCNILTMSAINVILFFGGWSAPLNFLNFLPGSFWFCIKMIFFVLLFVLFRAGLPRYRFDQLMEIGWQNLLFFSFSFYCFIYCSLWSLNGPSS